MLLRNINVDGLSPQLYRILCSACLSGAALSTSTAATISMTWEPIQYQLLSCKLNSFAVQSHCRLIKRCNLRFLPKEKSSNKLS